MLLLIRLVTSLVLFVFFFVVVYMGICILGAFIHGFMLGLQHHSQTPQESYEAGRQVGASFVRNNALAIAISSLVISLVASLTLAFSGILPWCRKQTPSS